VPSSPTGRPTTASLRLIRSVIYGYPSTALAINDLALGCGVPLRDLGVPSTLAAALAAPPPCGGTETWMSLTQGTVEGLWTAVAEQHRAITEGTLPGDFGPLFLRWDALYLLTFGQTLSLSALPAPAATAELNLLLVEAFALLTDAWVTERSWATASAMWTYAAQFGRLTTDLDAALTDLMATLNQDADRLLTEHDDRYQAAVAIWMSLAAQCQVEGRLPAAPLAPAA
jgi:hypothetical protein